MSKYDVIAEWDGSKLMLEGHTKTSGIIDIPRMLCQVCSNWPCWHLRLLCGTSPRRFPSEINTDLGLYIKRAPDLVSLLER